MSTAREHRAHARQTFGAVIRCAIDVCDEFARLGLEDDDRPRRWLEAVDRWCLGFDDAATLAGRSTSLKHWDAAQGPWSLPAVTATEKWRLALHDLRDARADIAQHVTHVYGRADGAQRRIALVWQAWSEPQEAAGQRVMLACLKHHDAIKQERITAKRAVQRARAASDRATLEHLLSLPVKVAG